uniref:Uncharacterized protein n=1 Tax=Anguilla anguilla TaxID=7936 RepID=A0A0E9TTF0_ANGAN
MHHVCSSLTHCNVHCASRTVLVVRNYIKASFPLDKLRQSWFAVINCISLDT